MSQSLQHVVEVLRRTGLNEVAEEAERTLSDPPDQAELDRFAAATHVSCLGLMLIPPEATAMGAPPHWSGYVCVDDCDAAAEKIKGLGGSVIRPPADIPGIGRFAVVTDPHGAVFEIMKPLPADPPRPRAPQGTLGHASWHELYAADGVR